jgi:hypothetical protein
MGQMGLRKDLVVVVGVVEWFLVEVEVVVELWLVVGVVAE